MTTMVLGVVAAGVIATLMTDIWARVLMIVGVPRANWGLVGRWVAGFPRGVFVHQRISDAPAVRAELAIGWLFHYAVGIAYAALYALVIKSVLESGPTLTSALLFGFATIVAPWFIMQPALGMGFMAARAPKPAAARIISISMHTVFGLGLYVSSNLWS